MRIVDILELRLSKAEADDFSSEYLYGMSMFMGAVSDYIAARCCILHGLFSGLYLASLSVEKVLKAIIYIESKATFKTHNLLSLKKKLKNHEAYGLDEFDSYLKKLYGDYQARYHDNPDRSMSMSSKELDTLDELWVQLVKVLPVPDEVKYNTVFFAFLFAAPGFGFDYWIIQHNKALQPKLHEMSVRFRKVFEHLYPNVEAPEYIRKLPSE